ncbi:winged helix-turn-helix domain-containing protein [Actinoplanes awajinensis]|uniref:Transcriptional regulator n=1 Tax=Actinoplanes awajinensis subsp. mycoplanecinus TaxID=135947 RepID=A0A117MRZ1_9ACTN|nr:winged helix-turn-helix domain-containing protein [Actinoplanes awajinensis]KUL32574.1 transcriptional regulator [Actinoplanes awajinensis subsp. mycoplanecinus]
MSALAIAHPRATHTRPDLRPVPDLPAEAPVTVTISIAGGVGGRDRVLAALRELVDAAGPGAAIELEPPAVPSSGEGEIVLDPRARTALRGGQRLDLSRLEYDLLLFLAQHPRQVFSRTQLLTHVWGHRHTTNRTVDVHVSRLRTKLDDPELITTVYGLGYRLADEAPINVMER